jgi:hypothetical protein
VADRAEHGRLDRVASPKCLRLERVLRQSLSIRCDGEQRGECRQEAASGREVRVGALAHVERPDEASARLELEGRLAGRGLMAGAHLDAARVGPEHVCYALRDARQLLVEGRAGQELGRDLCEQCRLTLAPLRVGRAPRARAARSLTTTDVARYTASANQFSRLASVSVWTGGRKKKLKASMLATETGIAYAIPIRRRSARRRRRRALRGSGPDELAKPVDEPGDEGNPRNGSQRPLRLEGAVQDRPGLGERGG